MIYEPAHAKRAITSKFVQHEILAPLHARDDQELNKTNCVKFLASLLLLPDVLPPLENLSKSFQKKDLDYSSIQPLVEGTIANIRSLQTHRGDYLSKLTEYSTKFEANGVAQPSEDDLQSFAADIEQPFLEAEVEHLKRLFPHTGVLSAFSAFSGQDFPEDAAQHETCAHTVTNF